MKDIAPFHRAFPVPDLPLARQLGEQATMFFRDPSGNALEFKSLRVRAQLFAK